MKKLIFVIVLLAFLGVLAAEDYVIVINKANATTQMDQNSLKNVFLGKKKTWDNGNAIDVCVLTGGAVHEAFLKAEMQKNDMQFSNYWKKAVYTGTGTAPKEFGDEKELLDYVAKNPNAIGYASAAGAGVKALSVVK